MHANQHAAAQEIPASPAETNVAYSARPAAWKMWAHACMRIMNCDSATSVDVSCLSARAHAVRTRAGLIDWHTQKNCWVGLHTDSTAALEHKPQIRDWYKRRHHHHHCAGAPLSHPAATTACFDFLTPTWQPRRAGCTHARVHKDATPVLQQALMRRRSIGSSRALITTGLPHGRHPHTGKRQAITHTPKEGCSHALIATAAATTTSTPPAPPRPAACPPPLRTCRS